MKTTKLFAPVLALALALALFAGCSGSPSASTPPVTPSGSAPANSSASTDSGAPADSSGTPYEPANKSITVGIPADPKYWDPWSDFNNGRRDTIPIIYQTLASYAPDLENGETDEYLVLASGYEQVSDNVYEVTIREGVYDTAGNKFTASDAVFCFETARQRGIWAELNAVDKIEVVSEYKFRMTTNSNLMVGDFQNILTNFPMVTQKSYEASPDKMVTTPVGTSGYVLKEYVPGSSAVFQKAAGYWNDAANKSKSAADGYCPWFDCTKLDTISFEIITDTSAMAIALESGDIDVSTSISASDSKMFQEGNDAGKFNIITRPGNTYCLSFNAAQSSPANNYNLRMALALCVDSKGVLDAAFDGSGIVLKAWAYPTYSDWQSSWDTDPYFEYNMALAKEYLEKFYKETGTTANTLKLRLLNQSGAATGKIAESIQAYIVALVGNPECVEIMSFDRTVYESMWEEADAFDLLLLYNQSVSRTTCAYAWSRNANASKTMSKNDLWHSSDKVGQDLLHAAIEVKTHSDANVAAFQKYINDKAYIKALVCGDVFIGSASWISAADGFIGYKDALAVLAFDYDWSKSGK